MFDYILFDLDGTLTDPKLGITRRFASPSTNIASGLQYRDSMKMKSTQALQKCSQT